MEVGRDLLLKLALLTKDTSEIWTAIEVFTVVQA